LDSLEVVIIVIFSSGIVRRITVRSDPKANNN